MPTVAAESVDISVCFDVLSLSLGSQEWEEMRNLSELTAQESLGVCVKGGLQICRGYSCAGRSVKF